MHVELTTIPTIQKVSNELKEPKAKIDQQLERALFHLFTMHVFLKASGC